MPPVDPAWAGKVQFYELLFGTWTVYIFLVWMWRSVLHTPLAEWQYVLITFLGGSAFWVNHYFQKAPFWLVLINLYTVCFLIAYWWIAVRGQPRSLAWKFGALASSIAFTVAFIGFEQIARFGVERLGMHEFCFMTLTFLGFVGVILWRARSNAASGDSAAAAAARASIS
jgi:signal transduction histidine kinase